jgi:hypothetical protein
MKRAFRQTIDFTGKMVPDVGFKTKRRKKSSGEFSGVWQRLGVNMVFASVKKPVVVCEWDGLYNVKIAIFA